VEILAHRDYRENKDPPGPVEESSYIDAYTLISNGNTQDVRPGEDVIFIQNTSSSSGITRSSNNRFRLSTPGSYLVMFQITVLGAGNLVLTINDKEQPHTIVSKNGAIGQISFVGVVTTSESDSVLTVRNPERSITTLRLTANEGAILGVTNHIVVVKL
jgi:hypothetical protein